MLNVDVALNNTNDQYQVTYSFTFLNLRSSAYLGSWYQIFVMFYINGIDT